MKNILHSRFGTQHLIGIFGLAAIALPWFFPQEFMLSTLSAMGIAIIFALSYNMLYGQAGMLSFGHAVYSGLGAYCAIHTLGAINAGLVFPVTLLPLVGGLAGLAFGVLFGYLSTKRAGTPFAMITLGLGELVSACAYMMPGFFGGELGISANRTAGGARLEHHLRDAGAGVLPHRRLDAGVDGRNPCLFPHASGRDRQRLARQRRALALRRL